MLLLLSFEISKKNYFHYIKNHFFYEKFQRADVIIFNIFIFTTKSFERGDKKSTKFFSSNFQSKSEGPHPSEKTQK